MTVKYDDEKGKKAVGAQRGKVSGKGTVTTKEGKVKQQEQQSFPKEQKDDRPAAQRKGVHKTSSNDNVNEANNSYSHQRVEDIQGGYFGVYGNNGRKNEKGEE